MKYDFETLLNRKNTNCLKWDLTGDEYPLWVADMDFKVAPPIADAVKSRSEHEIYGYTIVPDELFKSYINWWSEHYNFKMDMENMLFASGVMPAIGAIIRRFTNENDKILIQSPVYHVFFNVILDNNRSVVENELIYDGFNYSIDFDDLDSKLKDCKIMILCNPHNPIGKIWTKSDLDKIGKLCKKHDVILISDEIHCDLTDPNCKYNPFELLNHWEKTITCISPSKSFNIAGIQSAIVHTKNRFLHDKIKNQLAIEFSSHANPFGITATIAAYNKSYEWLKELKDAIYLNKQLVSDYLENEIPDLKLVECNATYLLWIDIKSLNTTSKELCDFLKDNVSVFLSPGVQFGKNGDQFFRMNIACPQKHLKEALKILKKGIELYKKIS